MNPGKGNYPKADPLGDSSCWILGTYCADTGPRNGRSSLEFVFFPVAQFGFHLKILRCPLQRIMILRIEGILEV